MAVGSMFNCSCCYQTLNEYITSDDKAGQGFAFVYKVFAVSYVQVFSRPVIRECVQIRVWDQVNEIKPCLLRNNIICCLLIVYSHIASSWTLTNKRRSWLAEALQAYLNWVRWSNINSRCLRNSFASDQGVVFRPIKGNESVKLTVKVHLTLN